MRVWNELKEGDFKNAYRKGIEKPIRETFQATGEAIGNTLNPSSAVPKVRGQGQSNDAWAQYQYLRALDAQLGTPWVGSAPESRQAVAARRRGFRFGE